MHLSDSEENLPCHFFRLFRALAFCNSRELGSRISLSKPSIGSPHPTLFLPECRFTSDLSLFLSVLSPVLSAPPRSSLPAFLVTNLLVFYLQTNCDQFAKPSTAPRAVILLLTLARQFFSRVSVGRAPPWLGSGLVFDDEAIGAVTRVTQFFI